MSEINIKLAAGTNVGLVRKNNEDNFVVNKDLTCSEWLVPQASETVVMGRYGALLVVADGMGGTNAGEVASAIAIETMQKVFVGEELEKIVPEELDAVAENVIKSFMVKAVKTADLNIVNASKEGSSTQGMGTTIVIAWILDKKAYICWCGDSRCYVFNPRCGFSRLSKDHSYVQELVDQGKLDIENAFDHPYSNIITRSLGDTNNRAQPDFRSYDLNNDDVLLLCSDGLCGLCRDEEMMLIIEENLDNMATCKEKLISAALAAGGYDNVTVAICHYTKRGEASNLNLNNTLYVRPAKHRVRNMLLFLLSLALVAGFIYYKYPKSLARWKIHFFPTDSISAVGIQESVDVETTTDNS